MGRKSYKTPGTKKSADQKSGRQKTFRCGGFSGSGRGYTRYFINGSVAEAAGSSLWRAVRNCRCGSVFLLRRRTAQYKEQLEGLNGAEEKERTGAAYAKEYQTLSQKEEFYKQIHHAFQEQQREEKCKMLEKQQIQVLQKNGRPDNRKSR